MRRTRSGWVCNGGAEKVTGEPNLTMPPHLTPSPDRATRRGKVVLCNCDDPYASNFFKYFALSFNTLGLKGS